MDYNIETYNPYQNNQYHVGREVQVNDSGSDMYLWGYIADLFYNSDERSNGPSTMKEGYIYLVRIRVNKTKWKYMNLHENRIPEILI